MTAYLVADIDVRDPEGFQDYARQVPALVERHGGTYLVRGGAAEVREGAWQPRRLVVIAFPDTATARAFLDDPDYAPVAAVRHRTTDSNVVVVEGV